MNIGAHISIAKGLDKACSMTEEVGGNTFQFFTRNPRGGRARTIGQGEMDKFKEKRHEKQIGPVLGHLPYTVNMAADKEDVYAFASEIVGKDLIRGEAMGAEYLVVHPGRNQDRRTGLEKITLLLADKLVKHEGSIMLLLETMVGKGSELGSIKDLGLIIEALGQPENLGVCLDSCHLFAAGWDFTQAEVLSELKTTLDAAIGLKRVKAMHINDSLYPVNSGKDRHAKIGWGHMGMQGIENIIRDSFFSTLPLILETPVDDYKEYGEEIAVLRHMLPESQ